MASKIGYIRKEIPEFTIPPYRGESYETVVPDTLDLAERAELAINGLTGVTDPETDHEIYFAFSFRDNCAILQRDFNDWIQPKFLEDLPLLRIITGSDFNHHVDRAWMEVFLHMIGPDGLAYMPVEGRPWGTPFHAPAGTVVWRTNGSTTSPADESVTQRGHPAMWNGRMLGVATIYYLRDNNPLWRQTIERIIQRLSELVIDKGNYSYLPAGFFEPNAQVSPDAEAPKGTQGAESGASIWLIQALAQ